MAGLGSFRREGGEWVTQGGMGLFWYTREKLGNCQIRVVFQLTAPTDNSGVFIRIPEAPATAWYAVNHGYEAQVANGGDAYHAAGSLYSLTEAKTIVTLPVGEWSTMLITLDGPRTRVEVNGQLVTDYTEGDPVPPKQRWYEPERGRRPDVGYIGLQNHDAGSKVRYKEVSVRPLR